MTPEGPEIGEARSENPRYVAGPIYRVRIDPASSCQRAPPRKISHQVRLIPETANTIRATLANLRPGPRRDFDRVGTEGQNRVMSDFGFLEPKSRKGNN